jgi:hypothetical protein
MSRADWVAQFGDTAPAFMGDVMIAAKDAARRCRVDLPWQDRIDGAAKAITAYLLADFEQEAKYWQRLDERGYGYVKGQIRDLIRSGFEGRPGHGDEWREHRRMILGIVARNYLVDYAWSDRQRHPSLDEDNNETEQPRGKTTWLRGDHIIGTREDLHREWERARRIVESMTGPYDDILRAIMETDNDGGSTGTGFKAAAAEQLGASVTTFKRHYPEGERLFRFEWSLSEMSSSDDRIP